jgi:hypothetical protein
MHAQHLDRWGFPVSPTPRVRNRASRHSEPSRHHRRCLLPPTRCLPAATDGGAGFRDGNLLFRQRPQHRTEPCEASGDLGIRRGPVDRMERGSPGSDGGRVVRCAIRRTVHPEAARRIGPRCASRCSAAPYGGSPEIAVGCANRRAAHRVRGRAAGWGAVRLALLGSTLQGSHPDMRRVARGRVAPLLHIRSVAGPPSSGSPRRGQTAVPPPLTWRSPGPWPTSRPWPAPRTPTAPGRGRMLAEVTGGTVVG